MEIEAVAPVRFGRELIAGVIADIELLMHAHWEEVGHYRDLPLQPDIPKYAQMERTGILRIYTARHEAQLIGYAIYLLGTALHYCTTMTAQQSTLYFHPDYRGSLSARFLFWTERELEKDGVQLITQHVKAKYDPDRARLFMLLLERHGYELQDYLLTKRLG